MTRIALLLLAACLVIGGCSKPADEAAQVPAGQQTVTAKGPNKAAGGGGSKGITEDQIELGPGLQGAENRAGSRLSGN